MQPEQQEPKPMGLNMAKMGMPPAGLSLGLAIGNN